eukprot:TRINITY_DN3156_c0_g1_i2.p1 TRINITY_DN3156_c0_g1~~TRINITY_DN3156_c0_g1_i2.p1  ORF type:complete len:143 (+),score=43.52 TRINITY_DN3156_c0_g1_i2:423-851(+)
MKIFTLTHLLVLILITHECIMMADAKPGKKPGVRRKKKQPQQPQKKQQQPPPPQQQQGEQQQHVPNPHDLWIPPGSTECPGSSSDYESKINRGVHFGNQGIPHSAVSCFLAALKMKPGEPVPRFNLAMSLEGIGDWATALKM